jgi:hypothetical protein
MNKNTAAALAITAFALAPVTASSSSSWADKEEIENYCAQEAQEKGIAAEKVADYVADCVATNLKDEKEIEGEVEGEEKQSD